MAIPAFPEVEREAPPTKIQPKRRPGGWNPRPQPRIGLGLGSDDELLMLENRTEIPWTVYHNFHRLGIIDPGELLVFHLYKHGSLNARPVSNEDVVEYLLLALNYSMNQVNIYKRQMSKDVAVYDMSAI